MPFDSGQLSFRRFAVIGQCPATPDEATLDALRAAMLVPSEIGLPVETEYGWRGPAHMLDQDFSFGNCVFDDAIHFALRIDTNKIPGPLKRAYELEEERAVARGNPSGFISKLQKRQVKEAIGRKIDAELREGKHRKTQHLPVLWDVPRRILYGPTSIGAGEKLMELFSRTFEGLELQPITSGSIAYGLAQRLDQVRTFEDLKPTRFARSPEDPDALAEYPWTAGGPTGKDFLGNEFLLWLWWAAAQRAGEIQTDQGPIVVMFVNGLQLDCVFSHTGKDVITAAGPTSLPEAMDGIRSGKAPRRAGLIIDAKAGQFTLTLTGDALGITGLKLPDVEEADSPRTLFEARIGLLRDACAAVDALFGHFMKLRSGDWAKTREAIAGWIRPTGGMLGRGAA